MRTRHIVIVTFDDGGDIDSEVFGPFRSADQAEAWTGTFESWWDAITRHPANGHATRRLSHMLITPLQSAAGPWKVTLHDRVGWRVERARMALGRERVLDRLTRLNLWPACGEAGWSDEDDDIVLCGRRRGHVGEHEDTVHHIRWTELSHPTTF